MREVSVKWETIKAVDAAICIWCRGSTRDQILNDSPIPGCQQLPKCTSDNKCVRARTIPINKGISIPDNIFFDGVHR